MKNKEKNSDVNLLSGKASFSDEPPWYKLIVILIMAIFLLLLSWLLKGWSIPLFVNNYIGGKIFVAFSLDKTFIDFAPSYFSN